MTDLDAALPSLTVIITVVPGAELLCAVGVWLITFPSSTVSLFAFLTVTMNPADSRALAASTWSIPTTLGTSELSGPELIDNVIVEFFATFVPAVVP